MIKVIKASSYQCAYIKTINNNLRLNYQILVLEYLQIDLHWISWEVGQGGGQILNSE